MEIADAHRLPNGTRKLNASAKNSNSRLSYFVKLALSKALPKGKYVQDAWPNDCSRFDFMRSVEKKTRNRARESSLII